MIIIMQKMKAKPLIFLLFLQVLHALHGVNFISDILIRQEIGNHLGLALETVSRLIKKFQLDNLIQVQNNNIEINNLSGLNAILEPNE